MCVDGLLGKTVTALAPSYISATVTITESTTSSPFLASSHRSLIMVDLPLIITLLMPSSYSTPRILSYVTTG